jgi:hypothetical protein
LLITHNCKKRPAFSFVATFQEGGEKADALESSHEFVVCVK